MPVEKANKDTKKLKKKKGFWASFKEFAVQGNVIDLAVGIVIGTAFKDVINSLVNDIIMPPLGFITARVDFTDLYVNLNPRSSADTLEQAQAVSDPVITYGAFINVVINFIIIALVIFLLVRVVSTYIIKQQEKEDKKPKPRCPYCMQEVHAKATKCPHCTSTIPVDKAKKPAK